MQFHNSTGHYILHCSKVCSYKSSFIIIIRLIQLEDVDAIRVMKERKIVVGREYGNQKLINVENTRTYFRHVTNVTGPEQFINTMQLLDFFNFDLTRRLSYSAALLLGPCGVGTLASRAGGLRPQPHHPPPRVPSLT